MTSHLPIAAAAFLLFFCACGTSATSVPSSSGGPGGGSVTDGGGGAAPCSQLPHQVVVKLPTGNCAAEACDPGWLDCDANVPGCETEIIGNCTFCGCKPDAAVDAPTDATVQTCTTAADCDLPIDAVCTWVVCDPTKPTDPRSPVVGCSIAPTPGFPCKGNLDGGISCDGTCGGDTGQVCVLANPCN